MTMPGDDHTLEKHSLTLAGHRTSVTLERAFWRALRNLARNRGTSISELVAKIDRDRSQSEPAPNLSSAIRVFILKTGIEKAA
jgi:predicted DNA-binding ribbon-helix-helix protein